MYILGISAFYHDSAACILYKDQIVAAIQEERITRKKHDQSFPSHSIKRCIDIAKITPNDIDHIIFYDKPFLKFDRILETYLAFAPLGFKSFMHSFPLWVKDKLFQKNTIIKNLSNLISNDIDWESKLLFSEHHLSHAASAFYPSPFDEAAILTMDGVGEWATTSLAIGNKNTIDIHKEIKFPHSIGLLYSAFTYYLGFKVNSGEYKVMGLAPYGIPKYVNRIKDNLIDIKEDGSFFLNMKYFNYCTGMTMTNKKFNDLFQANNRIAEDKLGQREMDIAASLQIIIEEIVLRLCKSIRKETNLNNLCLSGGVALNCVANGKIQSSNIFDNLWIQPASGDAGGALGAAYVAYYLHLQNKRSVDKKQKDSMRGSYLGTQYSVLDTKKILDISNANYHEKADSEIINETSNLLKQNKAIGWFSGKMEFGPRALGARSIIADPRSATMQKILNLKVKFRESFRPFAPSILREDLEEWFNLNVDSPYMLLVSDIVSSRKKEMTLEEEKLFGIDKLNIIRSDIPAITHVDYSARIQTVHKETNQRYYSLLKKFKEITGCPVIINTSFNIRGEPIVESPLDAFNCFMATGLDALVFENLILYKEEQDNIEGYAEDYKSKYELD